MIWRVRRRRETGIFPNFLNGWRSRCDHRKQRKENRSRARRERLGLLWTIARHSSEYVRAGVEGQNVEPGETSEPEIELGPICA